MTARDTGASFAELEQTWASRPGIIGFLTAVSHKQIGLRFIWTAVAFLLIGGVEALLIRLQLATSDGTVLGPEAYNQLFTMHGTTMMFLFGIPILEGLAMYFVPLQIGTRDLPLPRLNAFGYWVYLFGGVLLHWSFLTGDVPDGGWFAYPPLTGTEFSPGAGIDFWLLGVTFVEISGIIGAIEIVVLILRFRAPGMSLSRIPLFTWSALIMSGMMLFAFPFVIAASSLLELERKFGAPFYDPSLGGDPLLWQHLFWIFGHPEVYILLVPATGIVSAVVATHVRRPVVAYPLVVASLVAIAIASFGLWVHHMFAVGLPVLVLSLFAVASYFIAVPSGIQVFAWIATIWEGRPRWATPLWFVVGFLVIFVLGGITGVMVATAPFDHQAHDTFFVVAHFHYVLIGGVVFPVFAGLHHWFPKMTGRLPSERVGKTSFWLMFGGFNLAFFPQHWLGLQGMVRRTYTYPGGLGWEGANMASTIGAFVLAAGIVVGLGNLGHAWRRGQPSGPDPWGADTLEWAAASPPGNHNFDDLPVVGSLSPLWDSGDHGYSNETLESIGVLGRPWHGRREVLRTTVVAADPEAIVVLPGPTYWPFSTAAALTLALVGVLIDAWAFAGLGAATAVAFLIGWATEDRRQLRRQSSDPSATSPVYLAAVGTDDDPGHAVTGRHERPAFERRRAAEHFRALRSGRSPSWWAVVVGLVALATIVAALVYAYFYLRLGAETWPPAGSDNRQSLLPWGALALVSASGALSLTRTRVRVVRWLEMALVVGGLVLQAFALAASGYRVDANAYEAIVIVLEATAASLLVAAVLVRVTVLARAITSPTEPEPFEVDIAYWRGAVVLWALLWVVVHIAPRIV
ncbi:hypothetical protein BH23ACT5_BH23ACT5_08140 [soil metagenome]